MRCSFFVSRVFVALLVFRCDVAQRNFCPGDGCLSRHPRRPHLLDPVKTQRKVVSQCWPILIFFYSFFTLFFLYVWLGVTVAVSIDSLQYAQARHLFFTRERRVGDSLRLLFLAPMQCVAWRDCSHEWLLFPTCHHGRRVCFILERHRERARICLARRIVRDEQ